MNITAAADLVAGARTEFGRVAVAVERTPARPGRFPTVLVTWASSGGDRRTRVEYLCDDALYGITLP